jgi:hypothetical protein
MVRLAYRCRMAEDARTRFHQVAERRGRITNELRQEVLVSDDEFAGLASPRWGEQLRVASPELQATSHP